MKIVFQSILKVLAFILIFPIRIYQWFISPMLPQTCRYSPTCSTYAVQALKVWGPFKGTYLAVKRIFSCGPWGGHGYDPVPEKKPK